MAVSRSRRSYFNNNNRFKPEAKMGGGVQIIGALDYGSFAEGQDAGTAMALLSDIRLMTYASILAWFALGVGMANVNKWILSHHSFPYPLFLTTLHMLASFLVDYFVIRFTDLGAAYGDPETRLKLPKQLEKKILILSVVFSTSVALGNVGLNYLYVSFTKMIAATAPLFTIILARVLMGVRFPVIRDVVCNRPSKYVYCSMVPICMGALLNTVGEVNFHMLGFMATLLSTILRAAKSILQGVLLKDERMDSIRLLYHMSIPSFFLLLFLTLVFESSAVYDEDLHTNPTLWVLILLSCVSAVGYNTMTFVVTYYTSAVTLQVLGNVNMLVNVVVSVLIFQNTVTGTSLAGILVTLLGVLMYQRANQIRNFFQMVNRYTGGHEKE
ncbi:PREDICTED: probable sugar phosphate/phosphate translocator At5g04160 isoform X1 [Branchiostoma belcheri]|uniref:Probable sugar phosphate/phosphate translocator At5g04160 isoform X1 n=1 Tax=Branchiostoma belcheri TaxID=7741 RepID=A0A6P4XVQ4_BRABE|nr:PREDICTED: probable sugar phosphate/phosphate translocator At5g04160 isoform X1 [Branchiostoma belcheri]